VLADTEAKVASLREILLPQFVFLDLEASLKDFFGFGTADCDVDCDLFVSSDAKGADCVAGFAVNWCLTTQLFKHFGGTSKSVTRLADGDVQDQLVDAEFPHGV